jgi:hypothetical protein
MTSQQLILSLVLATMVFSVSLELADRGLQAGR